MEAAQPPVVTQANAAQSLHTTVSTEALLASSNTAPSWTQRLRFDLAPMISAVASASHQSAARPPTPYYPAPDTSWAKEPAIVDTESSEIAEPAPEQTVVVANTAETAPSETLLIPPVVATPPTVIAPPVIVT